MAEPKWKSAIAAIRPDSAGAKTEHPSFGKWRSLAELGRGGQGAAHLVYDSTAADLTWLSAEGGAGIVGYRSGQNAAGAKREDGFARLLVPGAVQFGALKALHAPERAKDPGTALARMRGELKAFRAVEHRHVLRLVDEAEDWFVAEFHPNGTLADRAATYKGDALRVLEVIRGLVEGVAALHGAGIVHRDIKPENIFVAADGRLVLGDLGLAYFVETEDDRLTRTHGNVGTRNWMPPWAINRRVDEVRPSFDVYSIGKIIWSLVTGNSQPPSEYDERTARECLGEKHGDAADRVIRQCWGRTEAACLANGDEVLREIDAALSWARSETDPVSLSVAAHALGRPGPMYLFRFEASHDPLNPISDPGRTQWTWQTNHHKAMNLGDPVPGIQSDGSPVGYNDNVWKLFQGGISERGRFLVTPPDPRSFDNWVMCNLPPISTADARYLQVALEVLPGCPFSLELQFEPGEKVAVWSPDPGSLPPRAGVKPIGAPELARRPLEVVTFDLWTAAITGGLCTDIGEFKRTSTVSKLWLRGAYKLLLLRIV